MNNKSNNKTSDTKKLPNNKSINRDIEFPLIKIIFFIEDDIKDIEKRQLFASLIRLLNDYKAFYKYDKNKFTIMGFNIQLSHKLIKSVLNLIFRILKKYKYVTGFHCNIIINKKKIYSLKCENKVCKISNKKISNFMSFINE